MITNVDKYRILRLIQTRGYFYYPEGFLKSNENYALLIYMGYITVWTHEGKYYLDLTPLGKSWLTDNKVMQIYHYIF